MKRAVWCVLMAALVLWSGPAFAGKHDGKLSPNFGPLAVKDYELKMKMNPLGPEDMCVHSIGQSHIDAAWKWRLKQTRVKVYNTWGQAIEHMDRHPQFTFSGSAPQYYQWILEDHPDLFEKIVEKEKEGRWELVGGQWVEPDGNMPDGESFVRQRLEGQRFYLDHFGHISEVGWMLDSFGYNWNYPQIMARSGAKYMWTSKLTWNDTTIFPFHNFWWRSPDGSEVLTHICPISVLPMYFPYGEVKKYRHTRYMLEPGAELVANYSTTEDEINAVISDDWLGEVGVFYGMGDGGLGPRELEVKIQEAMAKNGYSHFSGGQELFEHIAECGDRLPVWKDEMYLEYHRGVQTTQGWIKRANRKAEQMLRTVETLRSFLHVYGVSYPFETLKKMWRLALLQQFHDILPGSSIPEVYEDARDDYEIIERTLNSLKVAGLYELEALVDTRSGEKGRAPIIVYNSLGWERGGIVRVPAKNKKTFAAWDGNGRPLQQQEAMDGDSAYLVFSVDEVPPMGYKTVFIGEVEERPEAEGDFPRVEESGDSIVLENDLVKVAVSKESGAITSLVHKASGREMIEAPSNVIKAWHDRPSTYSAWNIGHDYLNNPIEIEKPEKVEITADGPLYSEVLVRRKSTEGTRTTVFEQRIRVMDGDPVVHLTLDSDFHMHDALVKVEFNTVVDTDTIAADGPYLVLEHPTRPETESRKAMWELICHKWIDLSDDQGGLALLNNGRYGYSLTEDGKGYRLSVIKGARYPRANPEARDVKHQYYTFPIPTGFTDQGEHHIEMGLLAHGGGWKDAKLWEPGYEFNTPMDAVWGSTHEGELPKEKSFMGIDSGSVYVGAVKKAEDDDDVVVRLVETVGETDGARLTFDRDLTLRSAAEVDLLELNPEKKRTGGRSVEMTVGPYQIKTLKLGVEKR